MTNFTNALEIKYALAANGMNIDEIDSAVFDTVAEKVNEEAKRQGFNENMNAKEFQEWEGQALFTENYVGSVYDNVVNAHPEVSHDEMVHRDSKWVSGGRKTHIAQRGKKVGQSVPCYAKRCRINGQ